MEPALPTQISSGITRLSAIIGDADKTLTEFEDQFNDYAQRADFRDGSAYSKHAKTELSNSLGLIDIQRLHLHTYLWTLWAMDSLEQANRFGGHIENPDTRPELPVGSFQYVAHAPLVVATLSTTALIEEVGGTYINKKTEMTGSSVDFDNTSCSGVLSKLEQHYPTIGEYDVDAIRSHVVNSRNDFSHYITRRGDAITLDNFEEYYLALRGGLSLVLKIVDQLIFQQLAKRNEVDF